MIVRSKLFLFGLISLVFIAAVQGDTKRHWGNPMEGCQVSVVSDHQQYQFGEPIGLHLVLQNISRPQLVFGGGGPFPYKFDVILPDGVSAPCTLWGQQIASSLKVYVGPNPIVKMTPGDVRTDDLPALNRIFDMTLEGKYTIVAHRRLPSATDPNAWIDVTSNPIVIEIKTQ